jgi:hypothetical protein
MPMAMGNAAISCLFLPDTNNHLSKFLSVHTSNISVTDTDTKNPLPDWRRQGIAVVGVRTLLRNEAERDGDYFTKIFLPFWM